MYEKYLTKLKQALVDCSVAREHGDPHENAIEYGKVVAYASIIESMGHEIDGFTFRDGETGLVRISFFTVDGVRILRDEIGLETAVRFTTSDEEHKDSADASAPSQN